MSNFIERLEQEHKELSEKYTALGKFIPTAAFDKLTPVHRMLLTDQHKVMQEYLLILEDRLELLSEENPQ